MRRPPAIVISANARETAGLLERTRERMDQQRIELRLTVMQTKARLAELKATLRAFRPFVQDDEG